MRGEISVGADTVVGRLQGGGIKLNMICINDKIKNMNDFYLWLTLIFGHWQNLLIGAGVGGVVVLILYKLELSQGWYIPKFWYALMFIFLFLLASSFWVWKYEHDAYMDAKQDLAVAQDRNTVKLTGKITNVIISPLDIRGNWYVLFFVSMRNEGADTVVKDYQAKASTDGEIIDLQFVPIPDISAKGLIIGGRAYYPMHSIYIATGNSLKKGDEKNGVILFGFKGKTEFQGVNPKWILSFSDYLGKRYEITYTDKAAQSPFIFKKNPFSDVISPNSNITGSTLKER